MTSLIGHSSAPSFDDPLEMLLSCHGRIAAQCETLSRLVQHSASNGNDEQAKQAARAILRYFDTAGQFHHQDEECDLFPLLRATHDQNAGMLITRLLGEHRHMDNAWRQLRPLLLAIAEDRADTLDAQIAEHFITLYAQHIGIENDELLPLASTLLDAGQLRSLGSHMAARRGVTL